MNPFLKNSASAIISYLFILLFIYASVSKILEFRNFQAQLGQSPLFSAFTGFVSYSVLTAEILVSVSLAIPKTRLVGLYSAFFLMILFTAYIVVVLNFSSFVPCSCGGILEKMDWTDHLIFNIIFCLLGAIGIVLETKNSSGQNNATRHKKFIRPVLMQFFLLLIGTATIVSLFAVSENKLHTENPFIRRFIQGAAQSTADTQLHNHTLYFAGYSNDKIYLADFLAPLHIFEYDTTLRTKRHFKIQLDSLDHPFRRVQVRIAPPYFFLFDGTVPVIYRGKTNDWNAKTVAPNKDIYFSQAEVIDSANIVMRMRKPGSHENTLSRFNTKTGSLTYAPTLLEKQIDGFFDVDGTMHYDRLGKKLVYTYFYRNQFIITDENLKLISRGKTIDTTNRANIEVAHIKAENARKLVSSSEAVNKLTTHTDNLLFINSTLRGRFETNEMWKRAAIVDIYDTQKQEYMSSIYIYNVKKDRLRDMMLTDRFLFVIIGNTLHRYSLSKHIKPESNPPAGEQE